MGRTFRRAMLVSSKLPFAYDPAKKAPNITLTGPYNNIATSAASATFSSVLGLDPMLIGWIYKLTLVDQNDTQTPMIAIGNASANTGNRLGVVDPNSIGVSSSSVFRGGSNLGAGPTYNVGDIVRAQLVNSTQVSFSVNGGSWTTPLTHGLTGTLYPGVTLYGLDDQVSAAWE